MLQVLFNYQEDLFQESPLFRYNKTTKVAMVYNGAGENHGHWVLMILEMMIKLWTGQESQMIQNHQFNITINKDNGKKEPGQSTLYGTVICPTLPGKMKLMMALMIMKLLIYKPMNPKLCESNLLPLIRLFIETKN